MVRPALDRLLLVVAGLLPTAAAWLYFVALDGHPRAPAAYLASKVVQFALPLVAVGLGWRSREPVAGGRAVPLRGVLASGLFTGGLLAAAILSLWTLLADGPLAAAAGPRIAAKVASFGASGAGGYLLLAVLLAGLHSGLEEIYWRWLVYGGLRRELGHPLALALSSLLFMAHHVVVVGHYLVAAGAGWILAFSLLVAAGGAVWAELYRRTGSLLAPWVSHVLADAALLWIGWRLLASSQ